jgi:hypothetical protein
MLFNVHVLKLRCMRLERTNSGSYTVLSSYYYYYYLSLAGKIC